MYRSPHTLETIGPKVEETTVTALNPPKLREKPREIPATSPESTVPAIAGPFHLEHQLPSESFPPQEIRRDNSPRQKNPE